MEIIQDLLTPNRFSRPQKKLKKVRGLVLHSTGGLGHTAKGVRNYLNDLGEQYKLKPKLVKDRWRRKPGTRGYIRTIEPPIYTFASTQYIVGFQGEIIQMIPDGEFCYQVGSRTYTPKAIQKLGTYPNNSVLGIEMCHKTKTGEPELDTYESTINLCVKLLEEHDLTYKDLWLHFGITRKNCHRWFVSQPYEWKYFKAMVRDMMYVDDVFADSTKETSLTENDMDKYFFDEDDEDWEED